MGVWVDDEIMGVCINGKTGGGVFAGCFSDGCPTHTLFVVPRPWLLQISGVAEKNRQYPCRIYSAVDNVGVPFSNNLYWETVARGGKELLVIYG